MSRNGSGTYSLPVGNPVVTGTTISSTWANSTLTDIASALTDSLAADGQTTATGNLNMGTNKITNTADPTNSQDVATKYYTDTEIAASAADVLATVTPAYVSDKVNTATGYFQVPQGSTLQRPGTPLNGIVRYNSDLDIYEGYIDGDWVKFQTFSQGVYTANYLVVGGGGGGANSSAPGGGGAGGYLASATTFTPGNTYTFIIGAGGAGSGVNGSSTTFTGIAVALGGGGGNGGNGGSGGGGGGLGTAGQGYNGGANAGGGAGGGGGGAGGLGAGGVASTVGGAGGVGIQNSITGSAIYYAGGGGGGNNLFTGTPSPGANGLGGGPTANRGGGGKGATINPGPGPDGENGGSGVVILSIPTANYTGTVTGAPTVTTFGSNTIITYTASGSYTA